MHTLINEIQTHTKETTTGDDTNLARSYEEMTIPICAYVNPFSLDVVVKNTSMAVSEHFTQNCAIKVIITNSKDLNLGCLVSMFYFV